MTSNWRLVVEDLLTFLYFQSGTEIESNIKAINDEKARLTKLALEVEHDRDRVESDKAKLGMILSSFISVKQSKGIDWKDENFIRIAEFRLGSTDILWQISLVVYPSISPMGAQLLSIEMPQT